MASTWDDKTKEQAKLDEDLEVTSGEIRDKSFDCILNFRDVGKTINEFLGEKYVFQPHLAIIIILFKLCLLVAVWTRANSWQESYGREDISISTTG
jgi:hypothetical protein